MSLDGALAKRGGRVGALRPLPWFWQIADSACVYRGWRDSSGAVRRGRGWGVERGRWGVLGSIVVRKWLGIKDFGWPAKGTERSDALADCVRGSGAGCPLRVSIT